MPLAANDSQWAAQLADPPAGDGQGLIQLRCESKPDALTDLARDMVNATARNYYLTVARELREQAN